MVEKYGFVYIWRDRKHSRYYIGCHWGTINDGYVCSSRWMRKSFRRRPEDFKRRILTIHRTREEMRESENKFLSLIKSTELGKKYYNICNHGFNHWSTVENQRLTVSQKISNAWTEERRKQQSERLASNNPNEIEGVVEKRLKTIEDNGGLKAWNKGIPATEESKKKHSEFMKGNIPGNKGKKHSEEAKIKMSMGRKQKWEIIFPDGRRETINNVKRFAIENDLSVHQFRKLSTGKIKIYKGYKIYKCLN